LIIFILTLAAYFSICEKQMKNHLQISGFFSNEKLKKTAFLRVTILQGEIVVFHCVPAIFWRITYPYFPFGNDGCPGHFGQPKWVN
jgi:hypothetical protein